MPDITMCTSKTCKRRKQCYRTMAKPDKYQSFGDFTKICADDGYRCLWEINGTNISKIENVSVRS